MRKTRRALGSAFLLLLLTSCASLKPAGAAKASSLSQFLCLFTSCQMTDVQVEGISGKPVPLLSAAADIREAGLSALLRLALDDDAIGKLGVLLPVTPVGQTGTRLFVCPGGKLAAACMKLEPNTPIKIWGTTIGGSPDLLSVTKFNS